MMVLQIVTSVTVAFVETLLLQRLTVNPCNNISTNKVMLWILIVIVVMMRMRSDVGMCLPPIEWNTRPCLLILRESNTINYHEGLFRSGHIPLRTLIKCHKGHTSIGMLCICVFNNGYSLTLIPLSHIVTTSIVHILHFLDAIDISYFCPRLSARFWPQALFAFWPILMGRRGEIYARAPRRRGRLDIGIEHGGY